MFLGRRLAYYLKTNWGAPFVIAFIVLLVASAAELSSGAADSANGIAIYGFYALVAGVALQIASYVKYGEAAPSSPQIQAPETTAAPHSKGLPRNTKVAAVAAAALIILAGVVVGYPMLSHPGAPPGGPSTSARSGCAGPETGGGSVYLSTNATVSIEICGQSYTVLAGAGGGLTYSYHAGTVNFIAPSSVNGSAFEFWYSIIGGNTPARASSEALTLTLPAGLSSQSSLIELYYAAPPASARSTTLAADTSSSASALSSASSASSSSSSPFTSTSTGPATSSSSSISATNSTTSTSSSTTSSRMSPAFCRGDY